MKRRRYALWQKVAALAPLALLLAYLPGQMLLRCRMDGSVRSACCCPTEEADQLPDPVARAQDCCDRELIVTARPIATASQPANPQFAPDVVAFWTPAFDAVPPLRAVDRAWRSHGPPRGGPTVVLLKQSFLI